MMTGRRRTAQIATGSAGKRKNILAQTPEVRGSAGVDYLALIDRSKLHYKRSDVTPIFADPAAFRALVEDLVAPWASLPAGERVERVVGTDALGFVVGTALALRLG